MNQTLETSQNQISIEIAEMLGTTCNFVITHKGGVGKTPVAVALTEYGTIHGANPKGYTIDAGNASFAKFKAYDVEDAPIVKMLSGSEMIDEVQLNNHIDALIAADRMVVHDVGSSGSCLTVRSYIKQLEVDTLLAESGKNVIVHSIVGGGSDYEETALGATMNAQAFSDPRTKFVIWLNNFRGPVIAPNGQPYLETDLFKRLAHRVIGVVTMEKLARASEAYVEQSFAEQMTYAEINADRNTNRQKVAVRNFYKPIFLHLDQLAWK